MRTGAVLIFVAALAGCQAAPVAPVAPAISGPAPPACELASFAKAPGQDLGTPKKIAAPRNKSEPLKYAEKIPLNRDIADTGKWIDAAPGWKAWRYWLHADARSVSVHIQPLGLPAHAEFWLCSPDRTTRKGPIAGKGPGDAGQFWSPEVPGPELWLEVLTPAGTEKDVSFTIAEAFAAPP